MKERLQNETARGRQRSEGNAGTRHSPFCLVLFLTSVMMVGCVSTNEELLEACMHARFDEARMLLKKGASPTYKDSYGVTPLFLSVRNDNVAMVKELLDAGADPNDWGSGYHPLCEAASSWNPEMWRLLIAAGANVNAGNEAGWTPLKSAITKGNAGFVELLISKGADVHASASLYYAVGNGAITRILLNAGARVNETDRQGRTPLHYVTSPQSARLLIEAGADINAIAEKSTPLDAAREKLHGWKTYHERVHGIYRSEKQIARSVADCEEIIAILESHGARSYKEIELTIRQPSPGESSDKAP